MRSDLLMMSLAGGGGLPPSLRRGLVAWYDPWREMAGSSVSAGGKRLVNLLGTKGKPYSIDGWASFQYLNFIYDAEQGALKWSWPYFDRCVHTSLYWTSSPLNHKIAVLADIHDVREGGSDYAYFGFGIQGEGDLGPLPIYQNRGKIDGADLSTTTYKRHCVVKEITTVDDTYCLTVSGKNIIIYFKNIQVFDLTETFGAGNEPDADWCLANIPYFESPQLTGQTLTDYSGHGNHATLGATDSASTDDPAWTGNSLKFDGVDDKLTYTPAAYELWAVSADGATGTWATALHSPNAGSVSHAHFGLLYDRELSTTEETQVKAYVKRLLAPRGVTI